MATCKLCDKSGWLLRVSAEDLCRECQPVYELDIRERGRVIESSVDIISKSKNLGTILSRIALVLEHLNALHEYEERGIPTLSTPPSEGIKKCKATKSEAVVSHFREQLVTARQKAKNATTLAGHIGPLSKIIEGLTKYRTELDDLTELEALETDVQTEICTNTADFYIEAGQKAEFKGQKKKALDQYLEALFALRHDVIDDALQQDRIKEVEGRILALGSEVPPA